MSFNTIVRNQDFQASSFGEYGFRLVESGFSQPAGEVYRAITFVEDSIVTVTCGSGDGLTAETFAAGLTIYGKFNTISVSSGRLIAYIGG
jgi:hypothetical protein